MNFLTHQLGIDPDLRERGQTKGNCYTMQDFDSADILVYICDDQDVTRDEYLERGGIIPLPKALPVLPATANNAFAVTPIILGLGAAMVLLLFSRKK